MDESWTMRTGTPPRRSTEVYEPINPKDFADVFGGPPRTRQYSGDFATSAFEDIFRTPNRYMGFEEMGDRTSPEFRIPASEEEVFSYIFGDSWRSRSRSKSQTNSNSKSKSNSSTILSSEELSPFRDGDDVNLSSFAAKIRPINVTSKWNTPNKMHEIQPMADSHYNYHSFESDYTHKFKDYNSGFTQMVTSPETTTTFGPFSYASVKESTEDMQVNSPASIVSSLNQDQGDETSTIHEQDDDIMSSYVIEINPSKHGQGIGKSLGVDDAIPGGEETRGVNNVREVQINESISLDKENLWTAQELEKDESLCTQMELELLDEDIKLWSDGKESNIRLLLSTLHHILWPSSGWIMIPLTTLKDSPNVRKAYQKARLCLHPDKLQQGATVSQKYVAERAFPILQDAWAAFISQDLVLSTINKGDASM